MARKKLLTEGEVRHFMKLANLGPLSENYFEKNPLGEQEEEELEMGAEIEGPPLPDEELGMEDEEGLEGGGEENEELLARVVQVVADELGVEVDVEGADEEGGEELEVDAELDSLGGEEELEMGAEEEEFPPANTMYQEGGTKKGKKKKTSSPGRGKKKGDEAYVNEAHDPEDEDDDDDDIEEGVGGPDFALGRTRQPRLQRGTKYTDTGAAIRGSRASQRPERPKKAAPAAPEECVPGDEECERRQAESLDHDELVAEVSRRVAARLNAHEQKEKIASQLAERIFNRLTAK